MCPSVNAWYKLNSLFLETAKNSCHQKIMFCLNYTNNYQVAPTGHIFSHVIINPRTSEPSTHRWPYPHERNPIISQCAPDGWVKSAALITRQFVIAEVVSHVVGEVPFSQNFTGAITTLLLNHYPVNVSISCSGCVATVKSSVIAQCKYRSMLYNSNN